MQIRQIAITIAVLTAVASAAAAQNSPTPPASLPAPPRTADGKPNLNGIWQAESTAAGDLLDHPAHYDMRPGLSVVDGGQIPYLPQAAAKRAENFRNRRTADPFGKCYLPGVPRIMYIDFPFQILQTPQAVAMTFEWSLVYRLIYTDGSKHPTDLDFWMGDSRGRWEGDTLVVDVANHNDKTWLDLAGDFHSDALHVVERYRMTDADTIEYEATIEDAKTFSKPWTIRLPLKRRTGQQRLLEYACQAEVEEANGAFERQPRTWYPGDGAVPVASAPATPWPAAPAMTPAVAAKPAPAPPPPAASVTPPPAVAANTGPKHWWSSRPRATANPPASAANAAPVAALNAAPSFGSGLSAPDAKPDFQGFYQTDNGGGNWGLGKHVREEHGFTPGGRGIIVDPPDGDLPMLPWAVLEKEDRNLPERGYDDPTAHCFVFAGVPRSMYIASPMHIIQTADYIVFLHERMSWRIIYLNRNTHIPDSIRLWQGDSIGRWEGNTLVVDTTNLNGKTWLNEVGEIVSYAEHVVERFTPAEGGRINYTATVTDPIVYSKPWTIAFPIRPQKGGLLEVACHEEDQDLDHLRQVKEAAAAAKKK